MWYALCQASAHLGTDLRRNPIPVLPFALRLCWTQEDKEFRCIDCCLLMSVCIDGAVCPVLPHHPLKEIEGQGYGRSGGGGGRSAGAEAQQQPWQLGPAMVCEAVGLPAAGLPGAEAQLFVDQAVIAVRR